MMQFTTEQSQAIHMHDKNLIVVAGAGSGKTRVLVERYLSLLEANPTWKLNALVAITFTREAALEMRHRVRQALEQRLQHATSANAIQRYADLLAQMDSARIGTIHGLCADILRANAATVGLDPSFQVLEPLAAEELLQEVIDISLDRLAEANSPIRTYLFSEYELPSIRELLQKSDFLALAQTQTLSDPEVLYETWQQEWATTYEKRRAMLAQNPDFMEALNWQTPDGKFPTEDKLMLSWEAVFNHAEALLTGDLAASFQAAHHIATSIKLNVGAASNWGGKEIVAEAKEALRTVRDTLGDWLKATPKAPDESDFHAAEMLVLWLALLQEVGQTYQAEKHARSYLDFSDLEVLTAQILTQYPDVRQRYQGDEFKHLLVDEFQDTNAAQWQIVKALASLETANAMFVVGDLKQSIYGFRGADVSVFADVKAEISHRANGAALPLSMSFRSHPALIDAFNTLFERLLVPDPTSYVPQYEVLFDQRMSANRPALSAAAEAAYAPIEMLLLDTTSLDKEEKVNTAQRRQWEAYAIAERLQELKDSSAPIYERGTYRPFDFSDAAILFRAMSNVTIYENVFKQMGIPFVTIAGKGYYNRQEVWDVLNLLKALHNPSDNLALASALRSPLFGVNDDALLALRRVPAEKGILPLWDALEHAASLALPSADSQQIQFAHATLRDLRQLAGRVTISELLRRALAQTGYLATLSSLEGGKRLRRNVEKLVQIAEASGKITLGAFARYLEDLTGKEIREGEALVDTSGVVRLMTVHASKGLEFPIVFLADTSYKAEKTEKDTLIYDSVSRAFACKTYSETEDKYLASYPYHLANQIQKHKEAAESKRLLYVAATRAQDALIICGCIKFDEKLGWKSVENASWLELLLDPLEVRERLDSIQDGQGYAYTEQAEIRVWRPRYEAELNKKLQDKPDKVVWKVPTPQTVSAIPLRLRPLEIPQERLLGHLAATQLADLGAWRYGLASERDYYRQTLRQQVLSDAPAQIKEALRTRLPRIQKRRIGDVVHEALRYWRFPDNTEDLSELLRNYAWQQGISAEDDLEVVIREAQRLLKRFQTTALYAELAALRANGGKVYSELPFIYRTEKRIIHGVIDLLYQRSNGEWCVLDFKTSTIPTMTEGRAEAIALHARRYHLQVGAYAAAVSQELGGTIIPRVQIHYIQYNETVDIPKATWQAELRQLESYIGELIGTTHYD